MNLSHSLLRGLVVCALTLLLCAAMSMPAMAVDLAWMRHEVGGASDLQVDHYGHDGGATVPEVANNQNTYGCCGGGGSIIGVAPLTSGGYVVARNDIDVNNGDNLFDSFVHDNDLNIVLIETIDIEEIFITRRYEVLNTQIPPIDKLFLNSDSKHQSIEVSTFNFFREHIFK